MASIKDVARYAKVGIGTVSRVLNDSGYVSKEARLRVENAIQELNYIPNERARNFSRKRSGIVGVVVPDLESPFYSKFIKFVEIELYKYGYKTMACNTISISNREQEYIDMLKRNIVDGIITGALSLDDDVYLKIDKPIVSMDHDFGPTIPLIHSDHKKGGRMVAERMLAAGCKNVVQIGGYFRVNTPSNDRYREFERIMKENQVSVRTIEIDWNNMDYSYYADSMKEYMDILRKVDGVFASDLGAISLHRMAIELGIRVPEELKIIAYDGMDVTRMVSPVITAVCQDVPKLAQMCVETILKLIAKESVEYHQITDVYIQEGGTA